MRWYEVSLHKDGYINHISPPFTSERQVERRLKLRPTSIILRIADFRINSQFARWGIEGDLLKRPTATKKNKYQSIIKVRRNNKEEDLSLAEISLGGDFEVTSLASEGEGLLLFCKSPPFFGKAVNDFFEEDLWQI